MIRVHHAGKMGDVIYSLPVLRALRRLTGEHIHLTTSGLCGQLVPLLEEQPYIDQAVLDDQHAYSITNGITSHWNYYRPGEGINLSLQPRMFEPSAPIPWTLCYAALAGVVLCPEDFIALPTLLNHRRWLRSYELALDGKPVDRTRCVVVAPECESIDRAPQPVWDQIIDAFIDQGVAVVLQGHRRMFGQAYSFAPRPGLIKAQDVTSVPVMARMIAEADGFIGAHSLPWQIARHAEVPAVCLQTWRDGLRRGLPIDTPCTWIEPDNWQEAVAGILRTSTNTVEA